MSETLTTRHHSRHRVQHALVLTGLVGALVYGTDQITGGYDNIRHVVGEMHNSALGLKNIKINDNETVAATSTIGTTTAACINQDAFSTDRVYPDHEHPNSYVVTVRKIGEGTLNAAAVESCIFDETGLHATIQNE